MTLSQIWDRVIVMGTHFEHVIIGVEKWRVHFTLSCHTWCRWQFKSLSSTYYLIKNLRVETNSIMKFFFLVMKFHCKWDTRTQHYLNLAIPNQTCNCSAKIQNILHNQNYENYQRKISSFHHNLRRSNNCKVEVPKLGQLVKM